MTSLHRYWRSTVGFLAKHQLIVLLFVSIMLSLAMTVLSVSLYIASGAQELDLSRPGYESVRDEVFQDERREVEFSAQGELGPGDIDKFRELYNAQRQSLNDIGDYDDEALSDKALRLFE